MLENKKEMARSRIGTLQWYASLTRPDLSHDLAEVLSELNKGKNTDMFKKINKTIVKLKNHREYVHTIKPIRGQI